MLLFERFSASNIHFLRATEAGRHILPSRYFSQGTAGTACRDYDYSKSLRKCGRKGTIYMGKSQN